MKDVKKVRRLPCYWLGTRKPTSLGYLPNLGIGTPEYTSVAGEDILPEVKGMYKNYIPNTLLRLTLNALYPFQALTNTTTVPASAAATAALNANLAKTGAALADSGLPGTFAIGNNLLKIGESGAATATKTGLSTAGKAAAWAGALYGAGSMASDIIHAGDHRTAGDMQRTLATNTYYTPGGHAYTQHGGLDLAAELAYGNIQKTRTQTDFLLDSMSTGASVGSLVKPGLGTAVGGAIGAAVGGLGALLGLGDNEEEIKKQAELLMDSTVRSDKQSRVLAFNQDTRDGFFNKSGGKVGAACGKIPKYSEGKRNAYVSHGETNVHKDGTYEVYPGKPDKEDSLKRHVEDSDTIFSNNKYVTEESASEYFQRTLDYVGAYAIDEANRTYILNNMKGNKKPGYANSKKPWGTYGEYALATLPHFGEYFQSLASERRAKLADINIPTMPIETPLLNAAINQQMSDMIDARDYLKQSDRMFNQAAWNMRRNPGLGYGGRMIGMSDLYGKKLAADADLWLKTQEANRTQRNAASNLKFQLGDRTLATLYDQFWKRAAMFQLANAARENWMEQARKNLVMAGINAAADLLRVGQYNKASDIQNKMIALYDNQLNLDWYKARTQYENPAIPEHIKLLAMFGLNNIKIQP